MPSPFKKIITSRQGHLVSPSTFLFYPQRLMGRTVMVKTLNIKKPSKEAAI